MTIEQLLNYSVEYLKKKKITAPILKSRILLCNTLKVQKNYLLINGNKEITEDEKNEYLQKIDKLVEGKPLQYITNHQEFMKLDFYVDENVLIPRPDTEIIVESVIEFCKENIDKHYSILDLCKGSGAIGISIAKYVPNCEVLASDISEKALDIATKNAKENSVNNIEFKLSNLFENINKKFDIIVSNPPYIKTSVIDTLEKEVQNEPHIALDGGEDGLIFYRKIIEKVDNFLNTKGAVFLEIGYDQKNEITKLIKDVKLFTKIECKKDLAGLNRMISFRKN